MSVKKYRLCLVIVLIVVLIFGAVMFVQTSKEEKTYTDGIMVENEYQDYGIYEEAVG